MWEIKNYNSESTFKWLNDHKQNNFHRYEKPIVLPNTPFEIEVTIDVYNDLKEIYVSNEEKGGIIFCKLIQIENQSRLQTVRIEEVENVFEPSDEYPGRDKTNAYRPDAEYYLNLLSENFSHQNSEAILFPIHFHTHPTKDQEKALEYYNNYWNLNTSEADQDRARERFAQFNNVKLRYMSAIITGHEDEHNILFYAEDVTPLDFMMVKFKRLQDGVSKFGSELASLSDDKDKQVLIKSAVELLGVGFLAFNRNMVDYVANMLEDKEYFGSLNADEPTIIKIPQYNKK